MQNNWLTNRSTGRQFCCAPLPQVSFGVVQRQITCAGDDLMQGLRIDPRDFILPPFKPCPRCGKEQFGVLGVHRHHYVRRCRDCWHTEGINLPKLNKSILYLDQFAISNMMKAINPRTKAYKAGRVDPFWRGLFERIDSLCKLQVLVCPDSMMHTQESAVAPYHRALKRMYEALSHGVSFRDPDTIKRFQITEHAKWWVGGRVGEFRPNLEPSRVLSEPIDGWNERFVISVEFPRDEDWVEGLRESRETVWDAIQDLFATWQTETDKDFDYWYKNEMQGFGQGTVGQYSRYLAQFARIQLGIEKPSAYNLLPPPSVVLINQLHDVFRHAGVAEEELWPKTYEYFESPTLELVPFCLISSMLWAAIARKAAAGQRRPPSQGTVTDIDVISTLLPYCDAMFVDRECHGYLKEEPLSTKLSYGARVFSLANKDEFLSYLDNMRNDVPGDHFRLVEEVYGSTWPHPFTAMYEKEQ